MTDSGKFDGSNTGSTRSVNGPGGTTCTGGTYGSGHNGSTAFYITLHILPSEASAPGIIPGVLQISGMTQPRDNICAVLPPKALSCLTFDHKMGGGGSVLSFFFLDTGHRSKGVCK